MSYSLAVADLSTLAASAHVSAMEEDRCCGCGGIVPEEHSKRWERAVEAGAECVGKRADDGRFCGAFNQ